MWVMVTLYTCYAGFFCFPTKFLIYLVTCNVTYSHILTICLGFSFLLPLLNSFFAVVCVSYFSFLFWVLVSHSLLVACNASYSWMLKKIKLIPYFFIFTFFNCMYVGYS